MWNKYTTNGSVPEGFTWENTVMCDENTFSIRPLCHCHPSQMGPNWMWADIFIAPRLTYSQFMHLDAPPERTEDVSSRCEGEVWGAELLRVKMKCVTITNLLYLFDTLWRKNRYSGVTGIFSGGGTPRPRKSYHEPPQGGPGAKAPGR